MNTDDDISGTDAWGHTLHDKNKPASDSKGFEKPLLSHQYFKSYRIIRQFPATGGEADIWLILKEKTYFILKHYRLGIEPKIEVLDQISHISIRNPKNLIKIIDYGFDDESERWYEILEYAKYGALRDLFQKQSINSTTFRTIIEEISYGLDTLHKNNILHLDLKPSNILIRELRPLNLILTDFGISTLLDSELSRHITTTKGTPMYWAPEQLGNIVGRESDYWALGVIALEIVQKKHPFEGLNHNLIMSTLASRGIIIPQHINPEILILLKGLLTRNPKKRWGKREVSLWLSGKRNIPVYYEEEHINKAGSSKPYEFHDENYYNLQDLMYAFISDPISWEDAKRHIGRGYLLRWLEATEQYNKAVTISKYIEEYSDEDERLLFIATELNKEINFILFGKAINVSNIVFFLGRALNREQDDLEERIITMLFSGHLERIYHTFLTIKEQNDQSDMLLRLFTWNKGNPRGITERNRLFQYARILQERDIAGVPMEWNAKSVISIINIYQQFQKFSANEDAETCKKELMDSVNYALSTAVVEPDLLVALSSAFEEIGTFDLSNRLLKKAYNLDIKILTLLYNKRKGIQRYRYYSSLVREYEKNLVFVSKDPWNESYGFWREKFIQYYLEDKFLISLSISERIIEMKKNSADGWIMRGISLKKLKRVHESVFCSSHKLVQSSVEPLVIWLTGEYLEDDGELSSAEHKYLSVTSGTDISLICQICLARIYLKQRRFWESVEICDNVLSIDPGNKRALYFKGDSLYAIGKIVEALTCFEEICMGEHYEPGGCLRAVKCHIKLSDYKKADDMLMKILREDDGNIDALQLKTYILLKQGKRSEAGAFFDKIRKIQPDNAWLLKYGSHRR